MHAVLSDPCVPPDGLATNINKEYSPERFLIQMIYAEGLAMAGWARGLLAYKRPDADFSGRSVLDFSQASPPFEIGVSTESGRSIVDVVLYVQDTAYIFTFRPDGQMSIAKNDRKAAQGKTVPVADIGGSTTFTSRNDLQVLLQVMKNGLHEMMAFARKIIGEPTKAH